MLAFPLPFPGPGIGGQALEMLLESHWRFCFRSQHTFNRETRERSTCQRQAEQVLCEWNHPARSADKLASHQAGVMPAEAKRIIYDRAHGHLPRSIGHIIKVASGIGSLVIDSG